MSTPWGWVVADAAEQQARQEHAAPAEEPETEVDLDDWEIGG